MFNPNDHMMKLKGKDYLQVAWRLVWFREDHPDWGIDANEIEITEDHAIFKAVICDADGQQKSAGHGSESKRDFGDFLEKAETKAIGRALAMLGYGTQFAGTELDEGERIVDSPVDRTVKKAEKKEEPAQDGPDDGFNGAAAIKAWCDQYGVKMADFVNARKAVIEKGWCKDIPSNKLGAMDAMTLFDAVEQYLKVGSWAV